MKKPIPRIWIFIILFAAIVIAHIIILRVVVHEGNGGNTPEPVPQNTPPRTENAVTAPPKKAAEAADAKASADKKPEQKPVKDEEPGFFKRLFGGG